MKYCPKDGFRVGIGEGYYAYCPECGEELAKAPKCSKCGAELGLTRFCVHCGERTPYADSVLQREE